MSGPVDLGAHLKMVRVNARGGQILRLEGQIDETFQAAPLIEAAKGLVVIDLAGVMRINSFGVREWINALEAIGGQPLFTRCRSILVTQFNLVGNFGAGGRLVSFYAPYLCEACGKNFDQLVDLRKDREMIASLQAPEARCPDCGAAGSLDDLPDSYFAFAAEQPPLALSALANGLIDNDPSVLAVTLKVEKQLAHQMTVLRFKGALEKSIVFRRLGEGLDGQVILDMSEVVAFSDEGIAGLARFTELPQASFLIGGLSPELAGRLASAPGQSGRASLCSLGLSFECAKCKKEHRIPVFEPELSIWLAASPTAIGCPVCGANCVPMFSADDLIAASGLPRQSVSEEVIAHFTSPPPKEVPKEQRAAEPNPPPVQAAAAAAAPAAAAVGGAAEAYGKYQLVRRIGIGGMAEVFLAEQVGPMGFRKHVVLKRILPHLSADEQFVEMFLEEARLAARISHPNVVQIFDLGEIDGQYFIAMEYVEGCDVHRILKTSSKQGIPIPYEVACRILIDASAGLHAAHMCRDSSGQPAPIIHRDVTPQNILLSHEGLIKLTDFGIAKALNGIGRTQPGTIKGTLAYLAPELIRGATFDARADIFAAGTVLYQLLTQQHPFMKSGDAATLQSILEGRLIRPTELNPSLPPVFDQVIAKALARDPAQRFASAQQMGMALEQVMARLGRICTSAHLAQWLEKVPNLYDASGSGPGSRGGSSVSSGRRTNPTTPLSPVRIPKPRLN